MRLRLAFDTKLNLGYYTNVVISIPEDMRTVAQLVLYLSTSFGISTEFTGRIWFSLEEFLVPPNQDVQAVFRDGDIVKVLVCSEVTEFPHEEKTVDIISDPVDIEHKLHTGDCIRFTLRGGSSYVLATVTGLKQSFESGDVVVVFEQKSTGVRDSMKLSDMNGLEIIDPSLETRPQRKRTVSDITSIDTRARQNDKAIAAVRRQIEWFVSTEGPMQINDLMRKQRIMDLTDSRTDLTDAIERSKKVRLEDSLVRAIN